MLSLKLALRFLKPSSGPVLSGFMSLASTVGIAIGVMALITGLSAMNGFEAELENRVLSVIPQVQVRAFDRQFKDAQGQADALKSASPEILAAAPAVELNAIVHNRRNFQAVMLLGIDESERAVINIERYLSLPFEELAKLSDAGEKPIILGRTLAESLNLKIGDTVHVMYLDHDGKDGGSADLSMTMQGITSYDFTLAGTLSIGGQLDSAIAVMSLKDALRIGELTGANAIHLKTSDFLNCLNIVYEASSNMTEKASLTSWMSTQGKLYRDIQMVRSVMYLAMIMVMGVACFNIIGTLFMLVNERRAEIAILLTLGQSRSAVLAIFCLVGLFKGAIGTIIGGVLGIALSLNLTAAMSWIESVLGIKFLNENIYFISFIPAQLSWFDVILISMTALVMSGLAALFPALKASRTDPSQILNG